MNTPVPWRLVLMAAVVVVAGASGAVGGQAGIEGPVAGAAACPVFPEDNAWNTPVDTLPVAENSDAIIRSIGADTGLHPDFGSGKYDGAPIGIPYTVVPGDQPKKRVRFLYADESDKGPYPIPRRVKIEGGPESDGDRHALLIDKDNCKLYELYRLFRRPDGRWKAGSGAIWDLRSNRLRPEGWTSADAAGLPILPGLARFEDVAAGEIDHALRFTVSQSRSAYIWPARHFASDDDSANLPPMGLRVRLRADFPVGDYPPQAQVILRALQVYGMMVADNGSDWFISGAPNPGWDNDDLHSLGDVLGSDFEVVDTSSMKP
ncbi:MAG TPA: hypothetical protein VNC78_10295 [Actinomycetota bacterium]|nr:hypothetical protein [Actinomycetota bacterium]